MAKVINRFINLTSFVDTEKVPTASDILTGKEAWANGVKIVGEGTAGGGDDYGYKRVSGVPDGAALLAAATDIEVAGVTYMPIYILINYANTLSDTYTKTGTGVSTGADAYLFSDAPTTLEVGTSVTHTWDLTQDIATAKNWKCRWVIAYAVKSGYSFSSIALNRYTNGLEFIGGENLVIYSSSGVISTNNTNNYFSWAFCDLSISNYYNNTLNTAFGFGCRVLVEAILPDTLEYCTGYAFREANSVQKITANGLKGITNMFCYNTYALKEINLPVLESTGTSVVFCNSYSLLKFNAPLLNTIGTGGFFYNCTQLKTIDLSNIIAIGNIDEEFCGYATWIELPTGFNISGVNFKGKIPKEYLWFYHLATQLADRSATTAGTIVLGEANLAILNSLYLEDGITPLTSVYDAKNWTRS